MQCHFLAGDEHCRFDNGKECPIAEIRLDDSTAISRIRYPHQHEGTDVTHRDVTAGEHEISSDDG
jgi:hypothetical protein